MTNNKQQTTVEWLVQEMLKPNLSMKEILEQAKEMHKEEMIKFGCLLTQAPQHIIEEAYNETYGGGEQ
jgi:hypothetical protein